MTAIFFLNQTRYTSAKQIPEARYHVRFWIKGETNDAAGTTLATATGSGSVERDGRPVFRDLRWGVYVVLEAPNDYEIGRAHV